MVEFEALYYDGRSSASRRVQVRGWTSELRIAGQGVDERVPLEAVTVEPPVGRTPRILRLPGGAQLRTPDDAAVKALFPQADSFEARVHRFEHRWPYALAALVIVAAASWWIIVHGVPLAAKYVAGAIPPQAEAQLGAHTLQALDRMGCSASTLDAARQQQLRQRLARLTTGLQDGYDYRLELRACRIVGPNAFALPGGTLVMTDALVKLARSDEQIAAVLAHEIGHVRARHGLRMALQSAGVLALISTLVGDAATMTSLVVALPTLLLQTGYSREFEMQADAFALQRMREVGIPPRAFADMLRLLDRDQSARGSGQPQDYFSTHPVTAARIERAIAAETDFDRCRYDSAPYAEARISACSNAIASGKLSGPDVASAYAIRGEIHNAVGLQQMAIEDLDRAVAHGSRDADVYNTLAWILATSTEDSLRNAARAKELALTACELTRYDNPQIVDTLAAAHAEAGEFEDAVRLQKRALESPKLEQRFISEARLRLELYVAKQPYRERRR